MRLAIGRQLKRAQKHLVRRERRVAQTNDLPINSVDLECPICHSQLARACEQVAEPETQPFVVNQTYNLLELTKGAAAGCRDCDLIVTTVRCYPCMDTTFVFFWLHSEYTNNGDELSVVIR